jgi:hypothetical protein
MVSPYTARYPMKRCRFSTGSEFLRLDIHRKGTIQMDSTEAASAAAGTDEIAKPSHIPVAASSPPDVLIGAGGDPLALGVSVFAIGALTLGMLFVGVFPAGAVGAAVPAVGMKPWPPLGRPVAAGADTPNSTIQAEDLT